MQFFTVSRLILVLFFGTSLAFVGCGDDKQQDYVNAHKAAAEIAKRFERCATVDNDELDKCLDEPIDPRGNCLSGYIRRTPESACTKSP